MALHGLMWML